MIPAWKIREVNADRPVKGDVPRKGKATPKSHPTLPRPKRTPMHSVTVKARKTPTPPAKTKARVAPKLTKAPVSSKPRPGGISPVPIPIGGKPPVAGKMTVKPIGRKLPGATPPKPTPIAGPYVKPPTTGTAPILKLPKGMTRANPSNGFAGPYVKPPTGATAPSMKETGITKMQLAGPFPDKVSKARMTGMTMDQTKAKKAVKR